MNGTVTRCCLAIFSIALGANYCLAIEFHSVVKDGDRIGGYEIDLNARLHAADVPPIALNSEGIVAFRSLMADGSVGVFTPTGMLGFALKDYLTKDTDLLLSSDFVTDDSSFQQLDEVLLAEHMQSLLPSVNWIVGSTVDDQKVYNTKGRGVFNSQRDYFTLSDMTDANSPSVADCFDGSIGNVPSILACLTSDFPTSSVLASDGQVSSIASVGETFGDGVLTGITADDLNDDGTVLWTANVDNEYSAIIRGDEVLVKTGDAIGNVSQIGTPRGIALNNNGDVLFAGSMSSLFLNDEVILRNRETIGGKTVAFVFDEALSESGQVAFGVRYTDQTSEIFVTSDSPRELLCDFDRSGSCDQNDLNRLTAGYGTSDLLFDLDDSDFVDHLDRDIWLQAAGSLPGDANLDGRTDKADLNVIGLNWQGSGKSWSDGDFNGDRKVNAVDLAIIGQHWNEVAGDIPAAAAVPEPNGAALILVGAIGLLSIRSKRQRFVLFQC